MNDTAALVWFRRDLRLHDHAALAYALARHRQLHAVFVFDPALLDPLPRADRRVEFIWHSLKALDQTLRAFGGGLIVCHGAPQHEIPMVAASLGVAAVYANHDDEPMARVRDEAVGRALQAQGRCWKTFKDHVIFERSEVLTGGGTPFSVFTPYQKAWLKRLRPDDLSAHAVAMDATVGRWQRVPEGHALPSLPDLGFASTNLLTLGIEPGEAGAARAYASFLSRMSQYAARRDFPALKGPSYLSVHLRFGTLSIRTLVGEAHARMLRGDQGAEVWLSELIWREFYFQILHHHPHVVDGAFKRAYDRIVWETGPAAEAAFDAWCEGRTGYPLVDAAMAQLNCTGYMHNRLRMVVASFLVKDLGVDWRRGEAYFARQLNDFDLAANNGGWQWAASSGCDAQPYFRIFNPRAQSQKFDPEGQFIKRYVPVLAPLSSRAVHAPAADPLGAQAAGVTLGHDYPWPIVDHDAARHRTLQRYAVVKAALPA